MDRKETILNDLEIFLQNNKDKVETVKEVVNFIENNDKITREDNIYEHITSSAWIVNLTLDKCLLSHHKKLDKWMQVGGHLEGAEFPLESSSREVKEESGLKRFTYLNDEIFDVVIFEMNGHKDYDIIYFIIADENQEIKGNHESDGLGWIDLDVVYQYTDEKTILEWAERTKYIREELESQLEEERE